MQELRLVAVSEDGSYAVLVVPGRSGRFALPIDERLRTVARGQFSRLAQYEIEVESPLRPKEIQDRIRAGETAEEIADAAGLPVERIRRFEGPVLAEREFRAKEAQQATVRGQSGPGPRLSEIVTERLAEAGATPDEVDWDSRKRQDGNSPMTTRPSGCAWARTSGQSRASRPGRRRRSPRSGHGRARPARTSPTARTPTGRTRTAALATGCCTRRGRLRPGSRLAARSALRPGSPAARPNRFRRRQPGRRSAAGQPSPASLAARRFPRPGARPRERRPRRPATARPPPLPAPTAPGAGPLTGIRPSRPRPMAARPSPRGAARGAAPGDPLCHPGTRSCSATPASLSRDWPRRPGPGRTAQHVTTQHLTTGHMTTGHMTTGTQVAP